MMRGGNREMRRMLGKMGLDMNEMEGIEEVIIKTETKEMYLIKPQVVEMKEKERETPSLKEEDIILVMQQANVSKEKAIQALTDSKGDIAQAILTLTT